MRIRDFDNEQRQIADFSSHLPYLILQSLYCRLHLRNSFCFSCTSSPICLVIRLMSFFGACGLLGGHGAGQWLVSHRLGRP